MWAPRSPLFRVLLGAAVLISSPAWALPLPNVQDPQSTTDPTSDDGTTPTSGALNLKAIEAAKRDLPSLLTAYMGATSMTGSSSPTALRVHFMTSYMYQLREMFVRLRGERAASVKGGFLERNISVEALLNNDIRTVEDLLVPLSAENERYQFLVSVSGFTEPLLLTVAPTASGGFEGVELGAPVLAKGIADFAGLSAADQPAQFEVIKGGVAVQSFLHPLASDEQLVPVGPGTIMAGSGASGMSREEFLRRQASVSLPDRVAELREAITSTVALPESGAGAR